LALLVSHHPDEAFDHAVLEQIEHSPRGIVPSTPSYQDSLRRLYAARQVFAHADYPDGHVTARSLAKLPLFYASNLDQLAQGAISPAQLESNGAIFDRYCAALAPVRRPAAEALRRTIVGRPVHHRVKAIAAGVHDLVHSLFLVPGAGYRSSMPGNYLYGSLVESAAHIGAWGVIVHDAQDGVALFEAPELRAAIAKLQELLASAPFHMEELEAIGFHAT
jgi:hypothetical protein